jgi:hypothetical protein
VYTNIVPIAVASLLFAGELDTTYRVIGFHVDPSFDPTIINATGVLTPPLSAEIMFIFFIITGVDDWICNHSP